MRAVAAALVAGSLAALFGCSSSSSHGQPVSPGGNDAGGAADGGTVSIQASSQKFPDLPTLWSGAISRTCGPNNGVCHNSKQFPDMQTSSGLLQAIGARCNQIRTDPTSVDNLCEPAGDLLQIGSFQAHVGNVTTMGMVAGDAGTTPASIVVTLDQQPPTSAGSATPTFVRQVQGLPTMKLTFPASAITSTTKNSITLDYVTVANPTKAPAPPPASAMGTQVTGSVATFLVPPQYLPDDDTQVQQGDPNGDGVFGATLGGAVIKPGDPLHSYLFLRVLGPLSVPEQNTNMTAPASNEAQMPLANFRYWDAPNAIGALYCWISTMKPDASNADGPIDYADCDLTKMPAFTPEPETASTFSSVYSTILAPQCAGPCHHAGTTQPTTFTMSDSQTTYDVLMGFHGEHPSESMTVPFITPGDPSMSFLYLKVSGNPSAGAQMPLGGMLPQNEIDAVGTWITQGANND